MYAILAAAFAITAYARRRYSNEDFADQRMPSPVSSAGGSKDSAIAARRIFGRPFVTAGWIVVGTTTVVAAIQLSLLALLLSLD